MAALFQALDISPDPSLFLSGIDPEKLVMPNLTSEPLRLAVTTNLEDPGEAIRALALAREVRDLYHTDSRGIDITFVSCGSVYDAMVRQAGFAVHDCEPRLENRSLDEQAQWKFPEMTGTEQLAARYIRGQLKALEQLRPDFVLHGMWPFGSIAARLLGLRTILFLSQPLHKLCVRTGLVRDIPDEAVRLAKMPRELRKVLARVGSPLMTRAAIFRQAEMGAAAGYCGWAKRRRPMYFLDALKADLTLITGLPSFHVGHSMPRNFIMAGPIYGCDGDAAFNSRLPELDPEIVAHMTRDSRPTVLLTMGNTADKELFFEAVRAVTPCRDGEGHADQWTVVVLSSPAVCRSSVARSVAAGDPRVLVTDHFVPGPSINALADVVVSHGGQATLQTAMAAGTPVVGVAAQLEQQINLDQIMDAGAGIRIQRQQWNVHSIRRAIKTVLGDANFQRCAEKVGNKMAGLDGARNGAVHMRDFMNRACTV